MLTLLELAGAELMGPELTLPLLIFPLVLVLLTRVNDVDSCGGLRLKENVGRLWMGGRGTGGGSSSSGSGVGPLIFTGAGWAV